ncbi:hypothetical protein Ancab_018180 [Ancistrocladus abbreviatus]
MRVASASVSDSAAWRRTPLPFAAATAPRFDTTILFLSLNAKKTKRRTIINTITGCKTEPMPLYHRHNHSGISSSDLIIRSKSKLNGPPYGSRIGHIQCKEGAGQSSQSVILQDGNVDDGNNFSDIYQGVYGPWTIDPSDVREVILYRVGLVTAAASSVTAASAAFLPPDLSSALRQNLDLFLMLGTAGLGLSLFLIHIYVTEIKRTLQVLWALGVFGSLAAYILLPRPTASQGQTEMISFIEYVVVDDPTAVWFVGPLFAALTGLIFKEGLCYGKLEAGILTFVIPAVVLGHLTGLMDYGVKLSLLGVWMALFIIFAARKFTQPIKDDIGDKSVFMFNSLKEEEKKALLKKLEQQKFSQSAN